MRVPYFCHFNSIINSVMTVSHNCSVAQRKRVGLITQRSSDRNRVEQHLFAYLFFLRIFYPFCLDTYLSFVICTFLIYLSVDGMDGNNEQILASSILLTIGHGIWYVKVYGM